MQISALNKSFEKMSSGYRINRAADDAAGLAISQKMEAASRTTNQVIENTKNKVAQNNIKDGKYSQATDYLQNIRQNLVKSSNGLLSDSDKADIANANNKLSEGLSSIFNDDERVELGLNSLDVNDIDSVDKALENISTKSAENGGFTNALNHFANYNSVMKENLVSSQSKITDTDYAKESSNLKTQQLLEDFKLQMQKQDMESKKQKNLNVFM